jgi:membrane fusion protein (multidrug efflux system)
MSLAARPPVSRLAAGLLCALLGGGCDPESHGHELREPLPVVVQVVTATPAPLPRTLTAVGSLRSPQQATLATESAGRVVEIDIPEGRQVAAGHVLARLDDAEYRAALRGAQARFRNADERLGRLRSLHRSNVSSEQALQDAVAAYDAARGALEEAQSRLEDTVIRTPFRGVLGLRRINAGDWVPEGAPIVEITQIDPLELVFAVPQRHAARVAVDQTLQGMADLCGARFEGRVIAVDPQIDAATRTLQVLARVGNERGELLPGMAVRLRLQVGQIHDALLLPQEAVVRQGTKHLVFALDENDRALTHEVRLGEFFADAVHVQAGVAPGERVVVGAQQKLRPGVRADPQPYTPAHNPNLELGRFGPPADCEL